MHIFDELVIPPSENHVLLLKYMLIISLMLFIPYICMMLGATFSSTYYSKRGKKEDNPLFIRFAKDVIDKLTITPSAEFALGTIPVLSAFFAYAQLLYMAETITVSMLALSAVLFIISFIFIYRYRTSFKVEGILQSFRKYINPASINPADESIVEIEKYEEYVVNANSTSGLVGKYLLLTASYIFAGTTALASSPDKWAHVGNILQVIFSWQTIFNFLALVSLAGIVTGAAIVFYFFNWQGGLKHMSDDYAAFVKKFAGNLTLISGISFPVMLLLSYLFLPSSAQSPSVFFYMVVVLAVTLVMCNMVYSMVKTSDTSSAAIVFTLVIVLIFFNVIKDQAAFGNATHLNTLEITKKAEELEQEAKTKTMQSAGIDPQQIFNSKCIACHKFDQKVIGPPYNETVAKYNGDVQKLAAYIFNPQKIDPNYPPMPNQGLKKKEATAMAQWLINKVGKK